LAVAVGLFSAPAPTTAQPLLLDAPVDVSLVKLDAARLRQLDFLADVDDNIMPRGDLKDFLARQIDKDMPHEERVSRQRAYIAMGLLPEGADIKEILVDLMAEQVAGFYDPHTKELYVVDDMKGLTGRITLLHELVHALQDQHWGLLDGLPLLARSHDDVVIAATSLIEGDASLAMVGYMLDISGVSENRDAIEQALFHSTLLPFSLPPDVPRAISEFLVFPYVRGMDFVMEARRKDGWNAIDALYVRPPVSTEQIIHPEKYYDDEDIPTMVFVPDISDVLGEGWRPGATNVLGELFVRIWLSEWLAPRDFADAPAGWDGDQLRAFEDASSARTTVVWYSVWDTDKDAREMFDAAGELIRSRFREGVPTTESPDSLTVATDTSAHSAQMRGRSVVVVIDCPNNSLAEVNKRLWSATRTAPFDIKAVEIRQLDVEEEVQEAVSAPEPVGCAVE